MGGGRPFFFFLKGGDRGGLFFFFFKGGWRRPRRLGWGRELFDVVFSWFLVFGFVCFVCFMFLGVVVCFLRLVGGALCPVYLLLSTKGSGLVSSYFQTDST